MDEYECTELARRIEGELLAEAAKLLVDVSAGGFSPLDISLSAARLRVISQRIVGKYRKQMQEAAKRDMQGVFLLRAAEEDEHANRVAG